MTTDNNATSILHYHHPGSDFDLILNPCNFCSAPHRHPPLIEFIGLQYQSTSTLGAIMSPFRPVQKETRKSQRLGLFRDPLGRVHTFNTKYDGVVAHSGMYSA